MTYDNSNNNNFTTPSEQVALEQGSRISLRPVLIRFMACVQMQRGIKTLGKSGLIVEKVTK